MIMGSTSDDNDEYSLDFLPKHQAERLKELYSPEFFRIPGVMRHFKEFNLADRLFEKQITDDVIVSPLMQILSITLNKDQDDGSPCEIYGTIVLEDEEGLCSHIYSRAADEPQRVRNGGRLMLSMPKGQCPIIPLGTVKIEISLSGKVPKNSDKNDDKNVDIISTSHKWDFKKFSEYDIPSKWRINGSYGFIATVNYIVYRHAVFVTVDATLLKRKEDDGRANAAHVCGTISAHCGNVSSYLFDKQESESDMVQYGSSIKLSSVVVVTPVWAPLVIQAMLWDCNRSKMIVDGKTEDYPAISDALYTCMIEGDDDIIEVRVSWTPAYMELPVGNNTHDLFAVVKRLRIATDQQATLVERIKRNLHSELRKSLEQTTLALFEVFSVSIHNRNKKKFQVWGSIKAEDINSFDHFFFKRDKIAAERLLHNQTVPFEFPPECMKDILFSICLDLKDEDDLDVSFGRICWCPDDVEEPLTLYDRKLCSVIPGDNGYYTALYCTIFDGGVLAKVQLHLIDKSSAMQYAKVYGCVRSQYSTFKYLSVDDEEYYTRKLYVRRIEDFSLGFAMIESQSKILLSESCVAVPLASALIIDVDLKVNSGGIDFPAADCTDDMLRSTAEHLKGQAIFSTEQHVEHWLSDETFRHQIEVYVEWTKC